MPAIVDCGATYPPSTTEGPYVAPDCMQSAYADYAKQSQMGYYGSSELIFLTNMDTESCAVACMYNRECWSFDINTVTGECRLLQASTLISCNIADDPPGQWQHYDRITSPSYDDSA